MQCAHLMDSPANTQSYKKSLILPSAHRTCVLDKSPLCGELSSLGQFFVVIAKTVYQHDRVSDKTIIVYGATRFSHRFPQAA